MEGFDKNLVVFEGGERFCFECEGGIGARELRKVSGLVGEDPLAAFGWEGHGRRC